MKYESNMQCSIKYSVNKERQFWRSNLVVPDPAVTEMVAAIPIPTLVTHPPASGSHMKTDAEVSCQRRI